MVRSGLRAACLMLAAASGVAQPVAAQTATAPAAATAAAYTLGPNDQIEVNIYGQPGMPLRLRITEGGTITLPLVGTVRAAGQTPYALAEQVRGSLKEGGYLTNPIVNVEVVEYVSRSVTLLGAVAKPGVYPLQSGQPLSRVLAGAGGPREGGVAVLLRRGGEPPQRLSIADIATGGTSDPILQAGDLLFVPEAEHFYIYGQVRAPGSYPVRAGMTFRQALSQGGGQNDAGTQNRIRLYRAGQESEIAELDQRVQDGDVMFVRERLF